MAALTALAIGAVASAAAKGIAANQAAKRAQGAAGQAAAAQKTGLDAVQTVDPTKINAQAVAADRAKITNQLTALKDLDPGTAALRDTSNAGLNTTSQQAQDSNAILKGLFDENAALNPADANFQEQLKARAQQHLDEGGSLTPEQQAEFVRAGLEQAGTSGVGAGSAAGRQTVGKLLASEQNALQLQREAQAKDLFGFATDLQTQRNQQLLGIQGATLNADQANTAKLLNLAQLADSRTPNVGLSGTDMANLAVSNQQLLNDVALKKAGVNANLASTIGTLAANRDTAVGGAIAQGIGSIAGSYAGSLGAGAAGGIKTAAPTYLAKTGTGYTGGPKSILSGLKY